MKTDVFPPPIAELLEEFGEIPEWDERYGYIIDLGRRLPPIDPALQTEENRVRGCMSTVWLVTRTESNGQPHLKIVADSDSQIVKGLIVILLSLFSGCTPAEVLSTDVEGAFAKLGLAQHLSANRRNGLYAMVNRIRALAAQQLVSAGRTADTPN